MGTGWMVSFLVLGVLLLFLEIFVPGGILGTIGVFLLAAGVFGAADSTAQGIAYVCSMLLVLGILLALSFRIPQTKRFWKRFSLNIAQSKSEGYVAPNQKLERFLGCEGIALSQLRPAGTAVFNGNRIDVVTEGGFIPKDSRIKVIEVEGTRVVVREISNQKH